MVSDSCKREHSHRQLADRIARRLLGGTCCIGNIIGSQLMFEKEDSSSFPAIPVCFSILVTITLRVWSVWQNKRRDNGK